MDRNPGNLDQIGIWSELKLQILKEYYDAYSKILSSQGQANFTHIYVDAFSGPGVHISKATGEPVAGSPLNALMVQPPFKEYHLIDQDGNKIEMLKEMVGERSDVFLYQGDCNVIIPKQIMDRVRYKDFRRGLFLIDPYGINLDWAVVEGIGKEGSVDMFLNFMIMDMNMNVLKDKQADANDSQIQRMNRFWGDDSWRQAAYSTQADLFGEDVTKKNDNQAVVDGYIKRLKEVAGFKHVSRPIAMRNQNKATVYFLLFASQKKVATDIVDDIFNKYRLKGF
jgi:three-Cys-motif partner protein